MRTSNQIREAFLQELPDLSKEWKSPSSPMKLDMNFVKHMFDEVMSAELGKERSDEYWVRYYRLRGVPRGSDKYILPSSLPIEWKERHRTALHGEGYFEKRNIMDDHLAGAIWPLIKAGRKPLSLHVRRFVTNILDESSKLYRWQEILWYWAIKNVFVDWYLFVIDRYLNNRQQLIEDMRKRREEMEDEDMSDEIYHNIAMEEKIYDREFSVLYNDAQLEIDSLHWWLSTQEIWLEPDEIKKVVEELGIYMSGGRWVKI